MHIPDNRRVATNGGQAMMITALTLLVFSRALAAADDKIANALKKVYSGVAAGPFCPTWESIEKFQVPRWYQDAKFGIFVHWGFYSVPALDNECYPRHMYEEGTEAFQHHVAAYGPQSKFGYKDFIPQFRAEKFDAARWADLFKKAGAKSVVPVAEHHDGFPMYDCGFTEWSAAKMGPKRDILGELASAIRKEGLHFCASTHRATMPMRSESGRNRLPSDSRLLYGPGGTMAPTNFVPQARLETVELCALQMMHCCQGIAQPLC